MRANKKRRSKLSSERAKARARRSLNDRVVNAERERDEAHAALRSCIAHLQNGSAISRDASHEFHCQAPIEVSAFVARMQLEIARANGRGVVDGVRRARGEDLKDCACSPDHRALAEQRYAPPFIPWCEPSHHHESSCSLYREKGWPFAPGQVSTL